MRRAIQRIEPTWSTQEALEEARSIARANPETLEYYLRGVDDKALLL